MKIICLTTRLPYPTVDGRSYTLAQRLEMISLKHDVYVCSFNQGNKKIELQSKLIKEIHLLRYPSFIEKILNVIAFSFIRRKPIQMSVVYSRKTQKKLDKIISNINPDIIICDMLRLSKYLVKFKKKYKIILDLDDLLSIRYKRNLEISNFDYIGQFKESIPRFALNLIKKIKLDRKILKFECKALYKEEIKVSKIYDKIVLISPKEQKIYNQKTNNNKAVCWPMCINKVYNLDENYDENKICFLGNIDYAPNQDTLDYIIRNIFSIIDKKYKLLVVGKCSDSTKDKYKDFFSFVEFTQEVPSIEKYVKGCLCLLAPIQFGSGIKTKILESMALCVPVITSEIGIEGLSVVNGENILVANADTEYKNMIELLSSREIRNNLAKNALDYIKNYHSKEKTEEIIESTIADVYLERYKDNE